MQRPEWKSTDKTLSVWDHKERITPELILSSLPNNVLALTYRLVTNQGPRTTGTLKAPGSLCVNQFVVIKLIKKTKCETSHNQAHNYAREQ